MTRRVGIAAVIIGGLCAAALMLLPMPASGQQPDTVEPGPIEAEVVLVTGTGTEDRSAIVLSVPELLPAAAAPFVEFDDPRSQNQRLVPAIVESIDEPPTVVLVLDTSGSMHGDRLDVARRASIDCVAQLPPYALVGAVAYADEPHSILVPSANRLEVIDLIGRTVAMGETATFDAVMAASALVGPTADDSVDARAGRMMILLTDGEDTVSRSSGSAAIAALDSSGFHLYALGIDPVPVEDGESTLQVLGQAMRSTLVQGSAADLGAICSAVADRIVNRFRVTLDSADLPQGPFEMRLRFGDTVVTAMADEADLGLPVGDEGVDRPGSEPSSEPAVGSGGGEQSGQGGGSSSGEGDPARSDAGAGVVDSGASDGALSGGGRPVGDLDEIGDIDDLPNQDAPARDGADDAATPETDEQQQVGVVEAGGPGLGDQGRLWFGALLVVIAPIVMLRTIEFDRGHRTRFRIEAPPSSSGRLTRIGRPVDRLLHKLRLGAWIDRRLEVAGLSMRPGEFVAALGLVVGALGLVLVLTGSGGSALLSVIVVPVLALVWLRRRSRRRMQLFQDQLGDTLLLMAGALRAGHSTAQALNVVADKAASPSAEELQRVVAEVRLGRDLMNSLHDMAERMQSEDVRWVVGAIRLNRELGGNLSTTLDNVASTIAARAEVKLQVKVMSAEGRMTATVLMALPAVVALILQFLNPGYLRPFVDDPTGNLLLGVAVLLLICGGFWISRLVKLEY